MAEVSVSLLAESGWRLVKEDAGGSVEALL